MTLFDPLSCTSSSISLPDQVPQQQHRTTTTTSHHHNNDIVTTTTVHHRPVQGTKVRLQKVQASEGGLVISRSDGLIFRVELPELQKVRLLIL